MKKHKCLLQETLKISPVVDLRFGDPIPFGESVSFVCEKGMAFEEDFHQTSFEVICQVILVKLLLFS